MGKDIGIDKWKDLNDEYRSVWLFVAEHVTGRPGFN